MPYIDFIRIHGWWWRSFLSSLIGQKIILDDGTETQIKYVDDTGVSHHNSMELQITTNESKKVELWYYSHSLFQPSGRSVINKDVVKLLVMESKLIG